jgi:hypothetical protein
MGGSLRDIASQPSLGVKNRTAHHKSGRSQYLCIMASEGAFYAKGGSMRQGLVLTLGYTLDMFIFQGRCNIDEKENNNR